MKFRYFNLFSFLVALLLVAGPLAGNVLAATDSDHAAHETAVVNQIDQNSGQDMGNMDMSGQNNNMNMSGQNNDNNMNNMEGMNSSGNGGHSGQGENGSEFNTHPNWPLIYGFIGFNLLVIIIAALMKNKTLKGSGVN